MRIFEPSRRLSGRSTIIALLVLVLSSASAWAEVATTQQMQDVCANWLTRSIARQGAWGESLTPVIAESGLIEKDGVVLARYYNIQPDGFVIVPVLMEMPPVKAYNTTGHLDGSDNGGIVALLRDQLYAQYTAFVATYGSASNSQPAGDAGMFGSKDRSLWNQMAVSSKDYRMDASLSLDAAGPLLTTSWHQSAPYNNYCPSGQSGRTVVGCVATALSQLMYFWKWPDAGFGSHSYYWPGDNSCGGTPTPPQTLTADFSDPYDWAGMRDSCDDGLGCNGTQQAALAELCYETGVALDMAYGSCASGAAQSIGLFAIPYYFKYDWSLSLICRKNYDLAGWFSVIQQEINAGRPIWYGIHSHEIVCDGWRTDGVTYEFHMNYGWGQGNTAWYVLDHLSCSWVSGGICPSAMENMVINIKPEASAYMSYKGSIVEPQGDGDAYAEPGESVNIRSVVRNLGWAVNNASVTLLSTDPYVTVPVATTSLKASLSHGQIDTVTTPASILIDPSCPVPYMINLTVRLQEEGGFSADYPLAIRVGNAHGFSDDAESGEDQWSHRAVVDRFNDQWHRETYRTHGGGYAWKAGGPGAVEYVDGSDGGLVTKPILLAPGSNLTFWHRIYSECGSTVGSAWDGGILMVSTDGVSWTKLFPIGGYPKTTIETGSSLNFDGTNGLFAGSTGWAQSTFDLSAWSGPIQLMFRFGSDGGATAEGWYVDDFWVGNTDEGLNETVNVSNNLSVKFSTCGGKGSTWADVETSGPALPIGYGPVPAASPRFYQPATTAYSIGSITFSLSYSEADLTAGESDLVLMAYRGGSWENITTSIDPILNTITGQTDGLYPLVLAERTTCCIGRVGDANSLGGDEPTIGDVSALIDAKFITGSCSGIINCLPEADINQSGGANPICDDITIGDISILIDYLFITGSSLGLNNCL